MPAQFDLPGDGPGVPTPPTPAAGGDVPGTISGDPNDITGPAGFQLGFHAIGDGGVRTALDAFAYAKKQTGKQDQDLRFRIEHSQVVAPEDFCGSSFYVSP